MLGLTMKSITCKIASFREKKCEFHVHAKVMVDLHILHNLQSENRRVMNRKLERPDRASTDSQFSEL